MLSRGIPTRRNTRARPKRVSTCQSSGKIAEVIARRSTYELGHATFGKCLTKKEQPASFQRVSCCIRLYTASHQGWSRKRAVTKDIAKLSHAMLGKCMVQYCSHKSVSTQGFLQVLARARHASISVHICWKAFSNRHSCGSNDTPHKVRSYTLEAAKLFLAGCSALLNRREVRVHKRWEGFGRRTEVRCFFFDVPVEHFGGAKRQCRPRRAGESQNALSVRSPGHVHHQTAQGLFVFYGQAHETRCCASVVSSSLDQPSAGRTAIRGAVLFTLILTSVSCDCQPRNSSTITFRLFPVSPCGGLWRVLKDNCKLEEVCPCKRQRYIEVR